MAKSTLFGVSFIIVLLWLASPSVCRAQSIQISPGPTVTLDTTTSQQFTATALDGEGVPLATQPSFIWSVESGVGSIGYLDGLYHSGPVAGTATVKVTGGGLSATVAVTVNPTPVTVVDPASATPNPAPLTMTNLSVLGGYTGSGGESVLTYTWAETSGPAAVTYSANGTHAARNTIVTFSSAGAYQFTVTIASPVGSSTTSSVTVTVDQTLTSIDVTPGPTVTLASPLPQTQQFAATALDQFGNAMASQPTFAWSLAAGGVGSITDTGGLYSTGTVTGSATVVAESGGVSGSSAVTVTTGPFMVYTEGTRGDQSMYSQVLPSGAPVDLAFPTEKNPEQPSISPDGLKIAFNDQIDYGVPAQGLIWVMNADGSGTKPLTPPADCDGGLGCTNPSWSPDGTRLVFLGPESELYTINADGSDVSQLTAYGTGAYHPTWSPDGSTVAFDTGEEGIWTIPASATGSLAPTQATNGDDDRFPHWSPDGSLIGFVRNGDIYFVPSDATPVTAAIQMTNFGDVTYFGGFSSDGRTIYYTTYEGAPLGQIWSQDWLTDADAIQLASLAGSYNSLSVWTPPATPVGPPVTVATAASATPNPVTGLTTSLSVLGAYAGTGGEGALTYHWLSAGPGSVTYSDNGTNTAKNTTATFTQAGSYTFTVLIAGPSRSTTSSVTVTVDQTTTSIAVSPGPTWTLNVSHTQQFAATMLDQFGNAMSSQPTFTWSLAAGSTGSISAAGLYNSGPTPGSAGVTATSGAISGSSAVTVTDTVVPFIVYVEQQGSTSNFSLNSQTLPSGTPINLDFPGSGFFGDMSISADGTKIALDNQMQTNPSYIWTMNSDGTDPTKLTTSPEFNDASPSWSPDGTELVFSANAAGNISQLFTMNADSSDQQQLTDFTTDHRSAHPQWSPDGSTVAFDDSNSVYNGIWTIPANAAGAVAPTQRTNGYDQYPKWSPDGSTIAFLRNDDVYFISSTATPATAPTQVTHLGDVGGFAGFSADGSTIYFITVDFSNQALNEIESEDWLTASPPVDVSSTSGEYDALAVWTGPF